MKQQSWIVKIFDNGTLAFTETFDKRGQATAYAMRWNKLSNTRYRAELAKLDTPLTSR